MSCGCEQHNENADSPDQKITFRQHWTPTGFAGSNHDTGNGMNGAAMR